MSYYFCMWSLEWAKNSELSKYESLFADLWWSVVKDGSFYVISDARPRMMNSFENRRVSQIWIDWVQQSLPLKCTIYPDHLNINDVNNIEINSVRKQFRIVQVYLPHNIDIYQKFLSSPLLTGDGQYIKPQLTVERIGYTLRIGDWYDPVFVSCDQLERLVSAKLSLQIGYSELSNIRGKYRLLVNPITKLQQEKYSILLHGVRFESARDITWVSAASDTFHFHAQGGFIQIPHSKKVIHFDKKGDILPNQLFEFDSIDVLVIKILSWAHPFLSRFNNIVPGQYRLVVDSLRKVLELKKI